jgi:triacylglycerol lipase
MSKYPVVLLHGMFGYGQQEITEKVLPYYGLWNVHIRKMFEKEGVRCVAPSLGPYTSAWNRACEAYAQLVGGRVDYGKVHSEKFGCERYGRTYKALLPEWGTKDANGDIIKVNFIGHSFGGVTARLLTQLLIDGSEEERNGTPENELSPLFKGGNKNLVHSITTLASPHNGATCTEKRTGKVMTEIVVKICQLFSIIDATPLRSIYDLRLDQYGITKEKIPFIRIYNMSKQTELIRKYLFENKDNIIYDLTFKGAKELNEKIPTRDNIYYFSFRGQRTVPALHGLVQIPGPKSFPLLNILGFFMGINVTGMPNRKWLANDLVINTESGIAPDNAPKVDFTTVSEYKPGIWHVMPLEIKDHMSFLGWKEDKEDFRNYYQTMYDRLSSLPSIDK